MRGRRFLVVGAVLSVVLTMGALATAQEAAPRRKVIRLETITVEGRIQKPQAFYILQRSNLNFDELERTESFLPKIIRSVDKEPF